MAVVPAGLPDCWAAWPIRKLHNMDFHRLHGRNYRKTYFFLFSIESSAAKIFASITGIRNKQIHFAG